VKRRSALSPGDVATARQIASLLLDYPDEPLTGRVPLLRSELQPLPERVADPLRRMLDHVESVPLEDRQTDYVETFDLRRRCCLYLTYYRYGDTRKRGMALLRFKHLYSRAGLVLDHTELPDHLCVVLEFAATGDARRAEALLEERRSPYAHVLHAVCATLPPVRADDREAALRLAQAGPPTEEVGLDPYGTTPFAPPEYMPGVSV